MVHELTNSRFQRDGVRRQRGRKPVSTQPRVFEKRRARKETSKISFGWMVTIRRMSLKDGGRWNHETTNHSDTVTGTTREMQDLTGNCMRPYMQKYHAIK